MMRSGLFCRFSTFTLASETRFVVVMVLCWLIQDELEAELEELQGFELEEELLQPAISTPCGPVHVPTPAGKQPARAAPQKRTTEEDEVAALQAEMAL